MPYSCLFSLGLERGEHAERACRSQHRLHEAAPATRLYWGIITHVPEVGYTYICRRGKPKNENTVALLSPGFRPNRLDQMPDGFGVCVRTFLPKKTPVRSQGRQPGDRANWRNQTGEKIYIIPLNCPASASSYPFSGQINQGNRQAGEIKPGTKKGKYLPLKFPASASSSPLSRTISQQTVKLGKKN